MIIANGSIQIKRKAVGGINPETGYATRPTSVVWGDPIPCQYSAVRFDLQALRRGEPTTSKGYSILVETQSFDAEQIRLTGRDGKVIGEFSISQIEPLEAVCMVRIVV